MTWFLVLIIVSGGEVSHIKAGTMASEPICNIAGAGMGTVMHQANPAIGVGWVCLKVADA